MKKHMFPSLLVTLLLLWGSMIGLVLTPTTGASPTLVLEVEDSIRIGEYLVINA